MIPGVSSLSKSQFIARGYFRKSPWTRRQPRSSPIARAYSVMHIQHPFFCRLSFFLPASQHQSFRVSLTCAQYLSFITSALPSNTHDWSPTGWLLQSTRVFSTTVQHHFRAQLCILQSNSHDSHHKAWTQGRTFCRQKYAPLLIKLSSLVITSWVSYLRSCNHHLAGFWSPKN